MATMNISLPDELKARMDANSRGRNWSAIARRAIEIDLDLSEPANSDREKANVRLRAAKQQYELEERPFWLAQGGRWIMNVATYSDIQQLISAGTCDSLWAYLLGGDPDRLISNHQFTLACDGALDYWRKNADQIDPSPRRTLADVKRRLVEISKEVDKLTGELMTAVNR